MIYDESKRYAPYQTIGLTSYGKLLDAVSFLPSLAVDVMTFSEFLEDALCLPGISINLPETTAGVVFSLILYETSDIFQRIT